MKNLFLFLFLLQFSVGFAQQTCKKLAWYPVQETKKITDGKLQFFKDAQEVSLILSDSMPPKKWFQTVHAGKSSSNFGNGEEKREDFLLVMLANTSSSPIYIIRPDRQLLLCKQAKDASGNWIDIETLYNATCTQSFKEHYNQYLPKKSIWLTATPKNTGSFNTKIRMKFQFIHQPYNPSPEDKTYYSNEIDGSIAPCLLLGM